MSEIALVELDRPMLASELFTAYLDQIVVHGFFHADPHPGNVLVTRDGCLALIDLGMVGRIDPAMQDSLVKLLLAVSAGNGTDAAAVAVALGRPLDDFDPILFRSRAGQLIGRNRDATMDDLQAGALVGELTRTAADCGLRLPPQLTMLGKTLLNLDAVVRMLDPEFDPNAAIQREGADLMHRKLLQSVNPANVMAADMEAKEFAQRLPGRVNKVMDALAEGSLTLNVWSPRLSSAPRSSCGYRPRARSSAIPRSPSCCSSPPPAPPSGCSSPSSSTTSPRSDSPGIGVNGDPDEAWRAGSAFGVEANRPRRA